jgi:hypothetical protein
MEAQGSFSGFISEPPEHRVALLLLPTTCSGHRSIGRFHELRLMSGCMHRLLLCISHRLHKAGAAKEKRRTTLLCQLEVTPTGFITLLEAFGIKNSLLKYGFAICIIF